MGTVHFPVRTLIIFYFLFLGILALLAQMILPTHFRFLGSIGLGSALVPLVVIYASLELGDERAPILAGLLGLMLDLTTSHRLGISILILSSISALIVTQTHREESHQWTFRLTFVMVGTFIYLLLDYLFFQLETSRWFWPLTVWSKITFSCLLNLILYPLLFLAAGFLPRLAGWKPDYEQQRSGAYL